MTPPNVTLWLDGELRHPATPQASLLDQALHDGSGVFEGIRAYDTPHGPAIFRLGEHMDRLQRGLAHFGHQADTEAMCAAIPRLLRANDLADAYLRPIGWLDDGGPSLASEPTQLRQAVAARPSPRLGAETRLGLTLRSFSYRSSPATRATPLKLCGGDANRRLAKREATRDGYDEALLIDDKWVCQASAANVFFVKGAQLIAVEHPDMLPGITRDALIQVGGAISRGATYAELWDADEILLCGTSAEITPVIQLDDRHYDIGPVTRALSATYQDIVHGRDRGWAHWLTLAGERRRGAA